MRLASFTPVISLGLALASPALLAAPSAPVGRAELQDAYSSQLQNSPSIFASAPVYHILPTENTITLAGQYQFYDVTVAPPGSDISSKRNNLSERLDLVGWTAAPYVAFLAKHFGVGFAGEVGKREAHYLRIPQDQTSTYAEHLGLAQYSGIGLNLFWTPTWSGLPKYAVPTVIIGGKALNVVESSSGTLLNPLQPGAMSKYQYSVQNYEAGCNVSLTFVKHFAIIPWVDFSAYRFSRPKTSTDAQGSELDPTVTDDARLFWQSAPNLTYGIDFAVRLGGVELHLGGLIGILGTLNKGSDRIQDNSHTLSLSLNTRGG